MGSRKAASPPVVQRAFALLRVKPPISLGVLHIFGSRPWLRGLSPKMVKNDCFDVMMRRFDEGTRDGHRDPSSSHEPQATSRMWGKLLRCSGLPPWKKADYYTRATVSILAYIQYYTRLWSSVPARLLSWQAQLSFVTRRRCAASRSSYTAASVEKGVNVEVAIMHHKRCSTLALSCKSSLVFNFP